MLEGGALIMGSKTEKTQKSKHSERKVCVYGISAGIVKYLYYHPGLGHWMLREFQYSSGKAGMAREEHHYQRG